MTEIERGDLVRLKSGGPVMTVVYVNAVAWLDEPQLRCVGLTEYQHVDLSLPLSCFVRVVPEVVS